MTSQQVLSPAYSAKSQFSGTVVFGHPSLEGALSEADSQVNDFVSRLAQQNVTVNIMPAFDGSRSAPLGGGGEGRGGGAPRGGTTSRSQLHVSPPAFPGTGKSRRFKHVPPSTAQASRSMTSEGAASSTVDKTLSVAGLSHCILCESILRTGGGPEHFQCSIASTHPKQQQQQLRRSNENVKIPSSRRFEK